MAAPQDPPASGIVTPEAVQLDFPAAGVGSRSIAKLLDLLIQGLVMVGLLIVIGIAAATGAGAAVPEWLAVTLLLVVVFLILFGYPAVLEVMMRGRTPGKAALGLRVVTREGGPVRFRHTAIRSALQLVDFQLTTGAAAVIAAVCSRRQQRLGDMAAGTLVLRERAPGASAEQIRFTVPSGGETYAATLDPAVLDAGWYQAVRTFLLRAPELAPDVRARVARDVAQPLAERLAHRPPPGVQPEVFLRCLAARYQERGRAAG